MAASITIDSVVRSALMTCRKPIHYYMPFLHHALRCTKELKLGILQITKSVRLTVDEYGEIDLPTDYVDWVRVGYERGPYVVPLGEKRTINRLAYLDGNGDQQRYPQPYTNTPDRAWGPQPYTNTPDRAWGWWPSNHYNVYREHTGKFYGSNDSYRGDVFQIIIERGKVYVGREFDEGDTILLEYVYFDSTSTQSLVSHYAGDCIEKYIVMKWLQHSKTSNQYEIELARRDYYNSYRKLISRMNPITKEMLLRLSRGNFKQSIKT